MTQPDLDFTSALSEHLQEPSENSLSGAYELGRSALTRGFGILDMLSLHDAAQKELVLAAPVEEQARVAAAVSSFFRELLSPFEMSFRGYREANKELLRLNEDLKAAYAELQAKQLQLVQSAKMASLGELVAGIAHEINNPLAFVLNHLNTVEASLARVEHELADFLTQTVKGNWQRARSRLHESKLGAERIRNLVLKLRTFSRLDEGEEKQVSMRESVASVLTILEHRYKDRIQVTTHFGQPDLVDCFPGLLNQAMMNLVANAIDAIPDQGTIRISVGAEDDSYVIVVADSGVGIPIELRDRVLEPFFTTKPVGQGTGLGLSITYSIVQKHRGTLELAPGKEGGTVATIRFPLRQVAHGSLPA